MGSKLTSKDAIEQRVYIYLCLYALVNVLTVAGSNIFMGLATAGLLHRVVRYHDDWREVFQRQAIFWKLVGILLLALLLSIPGALEPLIGLKFFINDYIYRLVLPVEVLFCVHEPKKLLHIAICFLAGMFINDMYAIVQGIKTYPNVNRFFSLAGIMPWACLLSMFIPVGFIGMVHCEKKLWKWGCGLFLVASCAALILNSTRGAWLATLVSLPIIMFFAIKDKRKFIAGIAIVSVLLAGAYQVMPAFQQRVQSIMNPAERSNVERRLLWQSSVNMFIDHPIAGIGYAQFQKNYQEHYVLPEAKERNLPHAHNNFFQFLAEGGILGFGALVALSGYLFTFAVRGWLKNHQSVYLLMLAVLMGFFLHGLTEYTLRLALCSKAFWLTLGLCFQWINLTKQGESVDGAGYAGEKAL